MIEMHKNVNFAENMQKTNIDKNRNVYIDI